MLLTPAGVERSASKQQSLSGLHYPGELRPSRFITSGLKIFVRFGLAPGLMVNTEIVSRNRRQRPQASCCSTVYQRYLITTEVQSIQPVFDAFIPLSWTIQCREYLKYLRFSRCSSREAPRVIFDFTKIMQIQQEVYFMLNIAYKVCARN